MNNQHYFQINQINFEYLTPSFKAIKNSGGTFVFAGRTWTYGKLLGTFLKRQCQKILNCFRSKVDKKPLTNRDALKIIRCHIVSFKNKGVANSITPADLSGLQDTIQKMSELSHCISRKSDARKLTQLSQTANSLYKQEDAKCKATAAQKIQHCFRKHRFRSAVKKAIDAHAANNTTPTTPTTPLTPSSPKNSPSQGTPSQGMAQFFSNFIPSGIRRESTLLKQDAQTTMQYLSKGNIAGVALGVLTPFVRNGIGLMRLMSPEINTACKMNRLA